ncbi:MAG TPA: efflux RND transporter periplasmic adaptor subunit [Thioalkalivibrio sp.]|nr:efflux RND transporter periplasmic adaptor subunit [Thioalkalivibrio sp.]
MKRMRHLILLLGVVATGALAQDVDATLDWSKRVALSTPASGVVREINVVPGQRVEAGARLGQLDDRRAQAELRRTSADVTRLKLTLEEAEREYARAEELYERTVIAERDRQLVEIELSVAKANHTAAVAAHQRSRVDLEDTRLVAPFAGIVLAVHVSPGETISNALQVTPMVTLASDRPMLARAWVDEAVQARLEPDQAVAVRVAGDRYDGQVQTLGLEVRQGESKPRYEIVVRFTPSDKQQLRAGQAAIIELP